MRLQKAAEAYLERRVVPVAGGSAALHLALARHRRRRRRRGHPAGRLVVGDGQSRHPGRRPADLRRHRSPRPPLPRSRRRQPARGSPHTGRAHRPRSRLPGPHRRPATRRRRPRHHAPRRLPRRAGRDGRRPVGRLGRPFCRPSPSATRPSPAASSRRRPRASSAISLPCARPSSRTDDECFSHDCADGMANGYRIDEAAASAGARALAELAEARVPAPGTGRRGKSSGCAPPVCGCWTPAPAANNPTGAR